MPIRHRFSNPFAPRVHAEDHADVEAPTDSKRPLETLDETDRSLAAEEIIDEKAQSGTQKAQASTQAWTKNTLIAAYVL